MMNVPTLTMEPPDAQAAYEEYRQAVEDTPNAEDEAIAKGYKILAAGGQLLNLYDAFRATGHDPATNLPKLAIARADAEWCFYACWDDPMFTIHQDRRKRSGTIQLPAGTFPRMISGRRRAMVPTIPPRPRPKFKLSNYHILWEAEWQPAPPVDPMLLRHIGGFLYAVLAAWDLTPLEQSVLAGRFIEQQPSLPPQWPGGIVSGGYRFP